MLDTLAGIPISSAFNKQFAPEAGWDGTRWFVAWNDYRAHTNLLDGAVGDLQGARVEASGTVLDPAGLALANDFAVPEGTPAVAGDLGTTITAYAMVREESPYLTFRITLRALNGSSAAFRNAGSNPASYTCNAPVLGGNWAGTVDLSTTGHSAAYLYAFRAQGSTTLPQGQVLLGSGGIARLGPAAGPLATFSFAVPNSLALCGFHFTTQALHQGTVSRFALSNAMDLVVGQ
jgi:hypothetical protein